MRTFTFNYTLIGTSKKEIKELVYLTPDGFEELKNYLQKKIIML